MSIKNKFPNIKPSLNLDFANTKRLDPRITFTRASTATYWDGVTYAKAEENLLKYSQDFENAVWVNAEVTITANATTAPDGTTTADTLTGNGVSGLHSILQTATTSTVGKAFSVYLKAGTNNFAQIFFDGDAAPFADFDLSTGTVGTTGGSVTATATAAGNGWYRCAVYTASTTATNPRVCLVSSSTAVRAESNSLSTAIYMWGAQLEQRSQATAYTPTTDKPITKYQPVLQTAASGAARFDHNPVTGESLGLLIEEQRTNLFTYGQGFDNAAWTKTDATVVSGAAVAPDGVATAFKLIPNAVSTAYHRISQAYSAANNTGYTFSIYAKAVEYSLLLISSGGSGLTSAGGSGADQTAVVDLANGNVLNNKYGVKVSHVGNGWYRCAISFTTDGDGGGIVPYVGVANSATPSAYTGDGYSGIYIWGAQLEAGAFPTSYVPTTTAAVTRAADTAVMTGTNFSSWYRQDEGTVYLENSREYVGTSIGYAITDGTLTHLTQLLLNPLDTRFTVTVRGENIINLIESSTYPQVLRSAFAVKSGDFARALNNQPLSTSALIAAPVASRMDIGNRLGLFQLNGHIKKLSYYPKRLTNTELQALTA